MKLTIFAKALYHRCLTGFYVRHGHLPLHQLILRNILCQFWSGLVIFSELISGLCFAFILKFLEGSTLT